MTISNLSNANVNLKWFTLADETDKEKRTIALEGKRTNIWKDIVKRFFASKWNISFLSLVVIIFIMVYIVKYFTGFSSVDPVSNASQSNIESLKPFWASDWNHNSGVFALKDIINNNVPWFNPDLPNPGDSAKYVLSQENLANGDVLVKYINPFAVRTFLGTDRVGTDVFSRLLQSASWSLNLAIFVATVETIIGVSVGIYLGYHIGKAADTFFMRFIEFFSSVPVLLWMFVFALLLGTNFWSMALVLIIVGWVRPVYAARMFTIKIKDAEFILAARASGASQPRILYAHILPNVIGRLLVNFVHRIPAVIFFETTLVFLGFAVGGESHNSIGNLVNVARGLDMLNSNITFIISISVFLLLFSTSLQIIANGIRDAFDPKVVK